MTLSLQSIRASYGSIVAVDGIDAIAERGRLTAVVGPNAAGKSTLLRCTAGIQACDGELRIDGQSVRELPVAERARRIAYMPQRPRGDVPLTVHELVSLARPGGRQDPSAVDALLDSLELDPLRSRLFPALSVGQQQRVVLARTLYQVDSGTGVYVLDEPTAPMDPRHAMLVIEQLRQLAERGSVVLVSIHDIGLARAVADDAWLLVDGRLVSAGPVNDVLVPARLEDAFGIPYQSLVAPDGASWLAPVTRRV